jgi:DNA-binding FadR family transcriptional regulator
MTRPTFINFKEKALNNSAVRSEYEALDALENQQDLANLRQFLEARVAEVNCGEVSAKSITEIAAEVVRIKETF